MANKKISQLPSGSSIIPLTGQTAVVYSGTTYQQTLSSLRQNLVDSGSHFYTGSQYINGNLVVTGSITAQEYIISSSVTHMTVQNVSGSSVFGDTLNDTHQFTGSLKITGSLTLNGRSIVSGTINHLAFFNTETSVTSSDRFHLINNKEGLGLGTDAFTNYKPERLVVDNGASYNIATFQTSVNDNYAQVNIKNFGSGSNSSADLVIWNNVSSESSSYVDLGINSSNYSAGFVGFGGDGYLINAANDLYVGSLDTVNHGHTHIFGGNLWDSSSISIYNDGTIGFNTDYIDNQVNSIPSSGDGFTYEFNGNVKLNNDLKVDGNINTDYIYGINQQWNYLALNGSVSGVSDVELGSNNNISLWAEGGYVNVTGSLNVSGIFNVGAISERVTPYDDTNTFNHSYTESAILYVTNISDDFIINISDISEDNNHALGFTTIVEQGSTAYTVNEFRIYNQSQSIMWVGGVSPTTMANAVNVFSFSFLRIDGDWKVFGQLTTF